jgi:hypothetical protein
MGRESGLVFRVTIDDGGMHESITPAIEDCAARGVVDCVSILPTGVAAGEACRAACAAGVAISVHLNCIQPPFLGGKPFPATVGRWVVSASRLAEHVRAEWTLQIEKLMDMGATLTGLDSHRHLHHLPALRSIALDLADEYGIGTIRTALLPDWFSRPSGPFLHLLGKRLEILAGERELKTSEWMLGYSCSGEVSRGYLERNEKRMTSGECEIVMHPAVSPVWSNGQPEELALMLSEWFVKWLNRSS